MQPQPTEDQWARWLSSPLSAADQESLEQFLATSEENRAQWTAYSQLWDAYGHLPTSSPSEMDTQLAWQRMEQAVRQTPVAPQRRVWLFDPSGWKVAASVALLLAALGYGWLRTGLTEQVWEATHQHLTIYLPDSSRVELRQGSKLWFSEASSTGSHTARVRAARLEGEAFFDVRRDPSTPFEVTAGKAVVRVRGTSFLVESYGEDSASVSVYTGKVAFDAHHDAAPPQLLTAGTSMRYARGTFAEQTFQEGRIAWHTGILRYEQVPLGIVLAEIEHVYNIRVTCAQPASKSCLLTATFRESDPVVILEDLAAVMGLALTKRDAGVFLLQGNCAEF